MPKIESQTRRYLRRKLDRHKKLQNTTTSLYLKYCNLVGSFHVLPNFMIIGFPKCGTTSLYDYLTQHPQIIPPLGKEIDFFDRLYERGTNWYRVRFPSKTRKFFQEKLFGKTILTGEATPRYVFHPNALQRIKKSIPDGKFIILLRNPIDRAYSHHNMNLHNGHEHRNFGDAIESEVERISGRYRKMELNSNYYSWDFDLFGYLEQGKYAQYIKKWIKLFPRENFLILQSEEFLKNPQLVYHQTLDFLNLPKWEPEKYSLIKKRDYSSTIDPSLRIKLSKYFKIHNEELYELIGKKFNWD